MKNGYVQAGMERWATHAPGAETGVVMDALDTILAAAGRSWRRARSAAAGNADEPAERERLRDAFRAFNDAAARLEGAYGSLQARVEALSVELSRANGELDRQLREKQALSERQAALLAALPAGVLVIDADGLVRHANAAAKALLGDSILGARCEDIAQKLNPTECYLEWTTPGDAPRRVNMQVQMLEARSERIVLLQDVTEAHETRLRAERSERLAAMGEMSARLAHQLRTPLATALLYASQLECEQMSDELRRRLGNRITSGLRSLERVTSEMLRFVRGGQSRMQSFDVGALLSEVADDVRPLLVARGIAFVCRDQTQGAQLNGDRRGIAGAVTSLLENAAQASRPGGKVRLEAIAIRRELQIRVIDAGDGIPVQARERLFEPFYSTRAEGTGLGLAIVKSVIEAHGGAVEVSSREREGAVFTITLPCSIRQPIDAPSVDANARNAEPEAA